MLKRYQSFVDGIFRVTDSSVIVAAWLGSYWLRFYSSPFPVTKGLPDFATYASLAPLVAVLWMSVFALMRVYESRRMLGAVHEVQLVVKAHGFALLLFIALTYMFEEYKYSRLVMAYFGAVAAVALVFFRLSLRSALRTLRKRGFNLRHILVVGEGSAVEMLIHRLESFPELGLRITGLVTQTGSQDDSVAGKPVLGHFGQIGELIAKTRADEVMIALPWSQQHEIGRLLDLLKDETLDIRLVPDVQAYVTLGCEVEDFNGVPVVRLNDSPLIGWGAAAKRVTDILLSAIALVILSPLLLAIALLIRLTSKGPILYRQERMGMDGRTFHMLKFRSMRTDAESSTGAVWARAGDDRRTVLGTLLRQTSLDELPQLWNVLLGEMSLVGPRPERPVFVDQFRKQIPHYMLRHKVKAGITG
ncbi:MAG TPA: exopolysaccharide biosynthesis polyprenyl glycosylphosphotransferase, partial [Polyangiaceae bacterium]|nr:exopolysaccharide biosynthesis polyprenyl glycosylphosphotransferase [Polyangiaceae bacterium]